ncbi:MAG: hypothetical protein ACK2UC_04915 [Anaerolineae bacterium]|jgi:hypothetical protein
MSQDQTFTEAEAHRYFAIQFNSEAWHLLEKGVRTVEEDERMICAAFASCRHWLEAGTAVHHQRAEWLIARVYAVLGQADAALHHAGRCLELTEEHAGEVQDFDVAYAYEAMARANAIAGQREQAGKYLALAKEAGGTIADERSKTIFDGDLRSGDWRGMR